MSNIYVDVANRVSFIMRSERIGFDFAFAQVMRNFNHDWTTARREVGSILGKRKKRQRKEKVSGQQMNLFSKMTREEHMSDAAKHEVSLIAGIPAHDL
ncbi:MAG: hypothetical protein COV32_00555 [Candidatus Yonathbacteria bacterium CG10_big_fil_rev_8_21_14_0_10_43_136]|uniref:Uncharacterized protein n=2 Tax=Parcubacteria group TaxID=1794811 RepID=A0A2M7Q512_9BACT|nr:MAG: hypothetical protein COW60_02465 [Candidatus Yonathbacteria bacterium CG17_big_fil_post_rev_8_21_14_2_50_43_9]PIR40929.1 MAG: hypothetical protein COV32_00555 [Candidatus Yonathbacteria bacterium CG10_big_fil_rev_8_21_14_0_10_43_136]PIX57380.1 MAG: hypothetical protein COZ48_00815 [Candidatus Yonathbacteria bacterium CG_4_10_14_3_um_filter_43_12]PIY58279.1 MAG: hypothetical protein COY98_02565 [Candidatus Yonathbacteria bacterium CG_4_10_14_0_8_um_filter_43_17]PJC22229.1 MAG: hypothetic